MTLYELLEETNQTMYRELSMMFHPDRDSGDANVMKEINTARDEGNWDKIKKLYRKYVETEREEEPIKTPKTSGSMYKIYSEWASEIQDNLTRIMPNGIHITVDLQGSSANAWVQWLDDGKRKQVYVPKIDRFKTKKDFEAEVLKKIKQTK